MVHEVIITTHKERARDQFNALKALGWLIIGILLFVSFYKVVGTRFATYIAAAFVVLTMYADLTRNKYRKARTKVILAIPYGIIGSLFLYFGFKNYLVTKAFLDFLFIIGIILILLAYHYVKKNRWVFKNNRVRFIRRIGMYKFWICILIIVLIILYFNGELNTLYK